MIIMIVTLFTSRIILQSLGVEDYGIYNVIGGVVSMFSVILGSMTDATQRFLTIELGRGEKGDMNKVFSTSLSIHIVIGIIIILIAEPLGLWFLYNKLIMPSDRLTAAFWVFQSSLMSLFVLVISIPYNALIVAHERVRAFAYISVIDAILRLSIAYFIAINFGIDKLILYAMLMAFSQILLRNIYNLYCHKNFIESKFRLNKDLSLAKEFGKFAFWSMMGNLSFVCSNFGVSLLLGTFFAPYVNAARGIALQIQGAFSNFVKNFQTAVNPQIMKSYAAGKFDEMSPLMFRSARLSFLLILIPIIPLLFETETILTLWLIIVPEYSVPFVRLIILTMLITTLINPLEVAAKATGKIKLFEIFVYGSKLLILPLSYFFLFIGTTPTCVFYTTLIFELIAFLISLILTHKLIGISIISFLKSVILRLIVTFFASLPVPIIITCSVEPGLKKMVILTLCSVLTTIICIFFLGLTKDERNFVINVIRNRRLVLSNK